jgi:hypothetical protein
MLRFFRTVRPIPVSQSLNPVSPTPSHSAIGECDLDPITRSPEFDNVGLSLPAAEALVISDLSIDAVAEVVPRALANL